MARINDDQNTIRRYLLGQLNDDEGQVIEQRLLTEDEFLEELEIAEAELIDEYLAGNLTETDRNQFEQQFLTTPDQQQNLQFARLVKRYVTTHQQPNPVHRGPFVWWSGQNHLTRAAAAVGVMAVLAGLFVLYNTSSRAPQSLALLTLAISDQSTRSEGPKANKISLPLNADLLRISLELPDGAAPALRYRVELENEVGVIRDLPTAGQDAKAVSVEIPAAQLVRGRYLLRLHLTRDGTSEQRVPGSYFFIVE